MKRKVEFLLSAAGPQQFPTELLPEVAFLGRSNVGKSSLINALVGQPIAKTSATPGCTRLINFFRVEDRFHLVDLPGYGYAQGPIADKEAWRPLIESYLRDRTLLRLCIVLLDSRRGWMDKDLELKDWLEHHNRPFVVAATKVDKLNQKETHHGLGAIRQALLPGDSELIPCSVRSGRGVRELWQTIWKRTNP